MSVCHVNRFCKIETPYGNCIKVPAVQIIAEKDIFVRFGEYEELVKISSLESKAMLKSGLYCDVQTVMDLSKLPVSTACYVIRRMVEHTASGFVSDFYEHVCCMEASDWLESEMKRLPIDVYR